MSWSAALLTAGVLAVAVPAVSVTLRAATPAAPAAAQAVTAPPPLAQSLQTISRLMTRVPNASVSLNFAEFKVRMAASKLQELAAGWPAEAPPEYLANVAGQTTALEELLRIADPDLLTKLLEAIADDLTVKAAHAQKGGAPAVATEVRTLKGGQEAGGWQVVYRPRVLDAAGNSTATAFPTTAGPARTTLVPGRYVIWGRQGAANGDQVAITVGEGLAEVRVDLPVPASAARP